MKLFWQSHFPEHFKSWKTCWAYNTHLLPLSKRVNWSLVFLKVFMSSTSQHFVCCPSPKGSVLPMLFLWSITSLDNWSELRLSWHGIEPVISNLSFFQEHFYCPRKAQPSIWKMLVIETALGKLGGIFGYQQVTYRNPSLKCTVLLMMYGWNMQ